MYAISTISYEPATPVQTLQAQMESLVPCTQLYVSIDASNEVRPTHTAYFKGIFLNK